MDLKRTCFAAAVRLATVTLALASPGIAVAQSTTHGIDAQGYSINQPTAQAALIESDNQAETTVQKNCTTTLAGRETTVTELHIVYHTSYQQANGLFAGLSSAYGICSLLPKPPAK